MSQNTASSDSRTATDDIRGLFPKEEDFQKRQKLTEQVKQLDELSDDLVKKNLLNTNDREEIKKYLEQTEHYLDYTRPYTISVVGASGSGKSTLINALLGRDIVAFKYGFATTGTIVTIHQRVDKKQEDKEKAKVVYYTRQELAEAVKVYCEDEELKELLVIKPAYINNDEAQGINISETLKQVESWSPLRTDRIQVAPDFLRKNQSKPKAVKALEDLLKVAEREEKKLDTSEIITLDYEGLLKLLALMDENSALNKDLQQRLIPLIKRIDFTILADKKMGRNSLGHVIVTDIPGTGAVATHHQIRLLEQLNPMKNDAVILVMASNYRFDTEDDDKLLQLVTDVTSGKSKEDEERIFLVVTKGDADEQTPAQIRVDRIEQGLKRLAKKISDTFWKEHENHIIRKTIAGSALMAQLIRAHPKEGREWLDNQKPKRFKHLEIDPNYYTKKKKEAQALPECSHLGPEEAVLEWSGIPQLRERLCDFLGVSRWERDLKTATSRYEAAYSVVETQIQKQWQQDKLISGGKPLNSASHNWQETFARDRAKRYGQQAKRDAENVLELFEQACTNLSLNEHKKIQYTLTQELKHTMEELKRKIDEKTTSPEAKRALVQERPHRYRRFIRIVRAADEQLEVLDYQIDQLLDQYAGDIADKLTKTLEEELEHKDIKVKERLKELCSQEEYITTYNDKVVGRISRDYKAACHGVVLALKMQHANEMFELLSDRNLGNVVPLPFRQQQNRNEAENTVEQIRKKYTETCEKLERTLPDLLDQLFFYHLALAEDELRQMIEDEMITALIQDVADPNSPLRKKYEKAESDHWSEAEKIWNA